MKISEYIEIKTNDGHIFSGLIMPSTDKKILSLKLNSGYNIGIEKSKIKSSKLLKKLKENKVNLEKIKINPQYKNVTILHTGGTVASKISYKTGAVAPNFTPEELVSMLPELKNMVNIKSRLISNIFSEDIRFYHYNIIAKEIEKEIKLGTDGIIITHGTDTLALTSCALSFILENLNKPIIFVGAQRSSDRPSSDVAFNLISAVNFIIKSDFNEVGICMHSNSSDNSCFILPACKTKKLHTSRRDAFKSINSKPIAEITNKGDVKFFSEYKKKNHSNKIKLRLFNEKLKIGILKSHPNMFSFEIINCNKYNGLVLEGSGIAGNFPINNIVNQTKEHKLIFNELKKLSQKIPIVISSNCVFGRINMNIYDTGRKMQDIGIIGNFSDMITETAFIKLSWLLSNFKKNEIKELFLKDFRGEISKRIEFEKKFI